MKTTQDVREILMTELSGLMDGSVDAEHAKAVVGIASQAIYATRIELENKRIETELHIKTDENRLKFIDGEIVSIPKLEM